MWLVNKKNTKIIVAYISGRRTGIRLLRVLFFFFHPNVLFPETSFGKKKKEKNHINAQNCGGLVLRLKNLIKTEKLNSCISDACRYLNDRHNV